eukprot:4242336-Amphidinium_carterae.1
MSGALFQARAAEVKAMWGNPPVAGAQNRSGATRSRNRSTARVSHDATPEERQAVTTENAREAISFVRCAKSNAMAAAKTMNVDICTAAFNESSTEKRPNPVTTISLRLNTPFTPFYTEMGKLGLFLTTVANFTSPNEINNHSTPTPWD